MRSDSRRGSYTGGWLATVDVGNMHPIVAEGVDLFNAQKFFECHEALEGLWLRTEGDDKAFLHGLIQVAAAFHHYARRNPLGFRLLLEKGWKKLEQFGPVKMELGVAGLRRQLQPRRQFLSCGNSAMQGGAPRLPRIERSQLST